MSIYVGEARTISTSDMQGPAPDGFHVPLSSEWQGLGTIMSGLRLTTGDKWRVNLHMPFAGYRRYSNAVVNTGNNYYWSSSPYTSSYPSYARNINLDLNSIDTDDNTLRANGCSVRCFNNSYVTPDSSWTVVQGTLGSAGIFWNQSEGLISITSDGSTGYTIQDKNLGATTVYNKGDTLTEENCGYFYQRGNNYGFAYSGTVTTSSTRVNASNYGPGNYYNSSTFITVSSTSSDWSSVQNDNLWGGVTQGTSTVTSDIKHLYIGANEAKEVYVGTDKVRPSIILITTPGIYHNPSLGLISVSSDGNTWYTIADKNYGATSTDTSSSDSYGNLYNWGASTPGWNHAREENWESGYPSFTPSGFYLPDTTFVKNTLGTYGIASSFGLDSNTRGSYLKIPMYYQFKNTKGNIITYNMPMTWVSDTNSLPHYAQSFYTTTYGNYDTGSRGLMPIRFVKEVAVQPDDTRTIIYQPS